MILVQSMFALFVVLLAFGWYQGTVLLHHLQLEHRELWDAMGRPGPWLPTGRTELDAYSDLVWHNERFSPPDEFSRVLIGRLRKGSLLAALLFTALLVVLVATSMWDSR